MGIVWRQVPDRDAGVEGDHTGQSCRSSARQPAGKAAKAGLPDAHFHDPRHAGLTLSAQTGATLAEVMRRAGHSSTAAAMGYQHAADQRDAAIAPASQRSREIDITPGKRRASDKRRSQRDQLWIGLCGAVSTSGAVAGGLFLSSVATVRSSELYVSYNEPKVATVHSRASSRPASSNGGTSS